MFLPQHDVPGLVDSQERPYPISMEMEEEWMGVGEIGKGTARKEGGKTVIDMLSKIKKKSNLIFHFSYNISIEIVCI